MKISIPLLILCFPILAIAQHADHFQTTNATIFTVAKHSNSLDIQPDFVYKNDLSKNKTTSFGSDINFKPDHIAPPNSVTYSLFPSLDKKEFIAESNKKLLTGTPLSPARSTYTFTIFQINFF